MKLAQIILQKNPEAILFDSRLNSALVGIGSVGDTPVRAVYSKTAIYTALAESGITVEDVPEYYHAYVNVLNSRENAPIVLQDDLTGG